MALPRSYQNLIGKYIYVITEVYNGDCPSVFSTMNLSYICSCFVPELFLKHGGKKKGFEFKNLHSRKLLCGIQKYNQLTNLH
jgi:hypothetical protein